MKQDNAGCYHSAATMLTIQKIATKHSITLKRTDFSDPQGGKGSCDRKAALIKNHMKLYQNAGNDIETAEQMKDAIMSHGGIPGVHVTLCGPQPTSEIKVKWDGVSLINNIEYKTDGIKVWRAYKIGPGKFLPSSTFSLPEILPEVNKLAVHDSQFVTVKVRSTRKFNKEEERSENPTDVQSDSEDDEIDQKRVDGSAPKLYFCPEEGCIRSFRRYHSLELHLDCQRHKYDIEHETLYDKAMKSYANKLEIGACKLPTDYDEDTYEHQLENPRNPLPMGWALKSTAKKKRFTEEPYQTIAFIRAGTLCFLAISIFGFIDHI